MLNLFDNNGATFSDCRKYRFALWRIWDESKPLVMFIGLNPSTANESEPDRTITNVTSISRNLGYGGFYMMNCFPFVSTNPADLHDCSNIEKNDDILKQVGAKCKDVIFAWGAFSVVKEKGRDVVMSKLFPNAKALIINKDGSPHHPLYLPKTITPILYKRNLPCQH